MDKPHLQVITTYPVAIKSGQARIHVPSPIPWHPDGGTLKCPKCDTTFILTLGFPTEKLVKPSKPTTPANRTTPITLHRTKRGRGLRTAIAVGSGGITKIGP